VSRLRGSFYVRDAATDLDSSGRKIIASQDFVAQHKVQTVFGFGGGYLATSAFVVFIVFTREIIEKETVEQFSLARGKIQDRDDRAHGSGPGVWDVRDRRNCGRPVRRDARGGRRARTRILRFSPVGRERQSRLSR
jgi:hypothetical protein